MPLAIVAETNARAPDETPVNYTNDGVKAILQQLHNTFETQHEGNQLLAPTASRRERSHAYASRLHVQPPAVASLFLARRTFLSIAWLEAADALRDRVHRARSGAVPFSLLCPCILGQFRVYMRST